jgi:hypothetical protein
MAGPIWLTSGVTRRLRFGPFGLWAAQIAATSGRSTLDPAILAPLLVDFEVRRQAVIAEVGCRVEADNRPCSRDRLHAVVDRYAEPSSAGLM